MAFDQQALVFTLGILLPQLDGRDVLDRHSRLDFWPVTGLDENDPFTIG
jgi:hypothetical protein